MRPIDADALPYKTHKWRNPDGQEHEWNVVDKYDIDNAPTIEPCKSAEQKSADVPIDDLVSRADAIEVGNKIVEELALSSLDWDDLKYWAKELFDALPTADRPTDESCRDCPIYSAEPSNVLQEKKPTPIEDYMTGKSRSADRPQVNSNSAEEQIAETCDRPKGEWLDVEHEPFCECSVCGAYIENLDDDFAFCPRCGADMRPEI